MTTPRGALHRDLEQRIRDLEAQQRTTTAALLRRKQLSVTQGDFVVSGGGGVFVQDGGQLVATYPNDQPSAVYGPLAAAFTGTTRYGIAVADQSGGVVFAASTDSTNAADAGTVQVGSFTDYPKFQVFSSDTTLDGGGGGVIASCDGARVMKVQPGVGVYLNGGAEGVNIAHATTAAAANCTISAGGLIQRSTSSRRYKRDVTAHAVDVDAALALQPRTFRSRAEVDTLGDDAPTRTGFIAEEAAELGLDHWVTRDSDGVPDEFGYAQWCVAQQAILQRQQQQLDDAEAERADMRRRLDEQAATIAKLSARLDALEA